MHVFKIAVISSLLEKYLTWLIFFQKKLHIIYFMAANDAEQVCINTNLYKHVIDHVPKKAV